MLQWPFAYAIRSNTVFLCSRCSQNSKPCGFEMQVCTCACVPAQLRSFPGPMLYEHEKKRSFSSTAGNVVLLSRTEPPGTCSERGGKGAAAVPGRCRYTAGAGPCAGSGGSRSIPLVGNGATQPARRAAPRRSPSFPAVTEPVALTGACVFFLLKPRSDPASRRPPTAPWPERGRGGNHSLHNATGERNRGHRGGRLRQSPLGHVCPPLEREEQLFCHLSGR